MIPPVPTETLPEWVQEEIKKPFRGFKVGDRVYGYLYNEPGGTIIDTDPNTGSVCIGWDYNYSTQRWGKMSWGAPYCVHYPVEE